MHPRDLREAWSRADAGGRNTRAHLSCGEPPGEARRAPLLVRRYRPGRGADAGTRAALPRVLRRAVGGVTFFHRFREGSVAGAKKERKWTPAAGTWDQDPGQEPGAVVPICGGRSRS